MHPVCLLADTTPVILPSPGFYHWSFLTGTLAMILLFYNLKQNHSLAHFTSYCPISMFFCKNKHTKTDFKKTISNCSAHSFSPISLELILLSFAPTGQWKLLLESYRWPPPCMLWWSKLSLCHTSFQGWWQFSTLDTFPTWLLGYQTFLLILPHWSHVLRWAANCTIPRDAT